MSDADPLRTTEVRTHNARMLAEAGRMVGSGRYGTLTVKVHGGKISTIERAEVFKPEDLAKPA